LVHAKGVSWRDWTILAFFAAIALRFRLLPLQRLTLTFGVRIAVFGHIKSSTWLQKTTITAAAPRLAIAETEYTSATGVAGVATRSTQIRSSGSAAIQETSAAGRRLATRGEEFGGKLRGREFSAPHDQEFYQVPASKGTPGQGPAEE
jgi:hypothetical protein